MIPSHQTRRLRMGLIGGGGAGFIGKVHATAATLDNRATLLAGALSSDPDRSKASAAAFGIDSERAYQSYQELLEKESQLPDDQRIDFVSIATPNYTHAPIAIAALKAGFHVVCDKPMTTNMQDANEMVEATESSGQLFALTHNYSGYPMIRQARQMVANEELGDVIAVRTSYIQGGMCGQKASGTPARGAWKSDPTLNGQAGSLGDIGTHAFHLASFVTETQPESLLCRMKSYSNHHELDDYGHALLNFQNGATGMVTWSQVTHGRLNDLSLEIDGTRGSLSWRQEEPNQLFVRSQGKATQIYERNPKAQYASTDAAVACRLPGGHPEAFFEAFANVYANAFDDMIRIAEGQTVDLSKSIYPNVFDGRAGVRFLDRCLASNEGESSWQAW
jgi:predicted dehydrogenase